MFASPSARRFALAVVLALAGSAAARAGVTVEEVVEDAARDFSAECQRQGQSAVVVGIIASPPGKTVTTGPGIAHQLTEALKKRGIRVADQAKVSVSGKMIFNAAAAILRLELVLEDDTGTVLVKKNREVNDKEDVAEKMTPPSLTVPAGTPPSQLPKVVADAIQNPKPNIKGTRIATADGKYSFEVLVNGQPRPVLQPEGSPLAYVELKPGEVYTIRLHNDSDLDASAKVTIDGLSVFDFADGGNKPGGRIVPKGKSSEIRGWYLNDQQSDQFKVAAFDQARDKHLIRGNVATISASFAGFFSQGTPVPPGELSDGSVAEDLVTVRGQKQEDRTVLVDGKIGKLRGVASVRYQQ